MSGEATNELNIFFTSRDEISIIHDKKKNNIEVSVNYIDANLTFRCGFALWQRYIKAA